MTVYYILQQKQNKPQFQIPSHEKTGTLTLTVKSDKITDIMQIQVKQPHYAHRVIHYLQT